jgi:hypothetical protein
MQFVRALCLLLLLSGCGRLDAYTTFGPDSWRAKKPEPAPVADPEPDAPRLIRDNLKLIFLEHAQASDVRISRVRREPRGSGWNVCIKASLASLTQARLVRTYIVPIERGEIGTRRVAAPTDGCDGESYTRI